MVNAIEQGYPQREIHEASYVYQKAIERKEKIIVGVNEFVLEEEPPIDILLIDESAAERQVNQLRKLRETRDNERVRASLAQLKKGNVDVHFTDSPVAGFETKQDGDLAISNTSGPIEVAPEGIAGLFRKRRPSLRPRRTRPPAPAQQRPSLPRRAVSPRRAFSGGCRPTAAQHSRTSRAPHRPH